MLRLLAGPVGEPDDREPGNAGLHVRLDLDLSRLETDESMSDRACEHALPTVGAKALHRGNAFAPRVLQVDQGV